MFIDKSSKKVLIIEDDPIVGSIYRSRLEKEGYQVELASDGQSGFFAVHSMNPDGVLLDIMLPKMNGIDLLRKIRAQQRYRNLPVVVVTNAYVASMVHDAATAGASMVLNKSTLTPQEIGDRLQELMYPGIKFAPSVPDEASPAPMPLPTVQVAPARSSTVALPGRVQSHETASGKPAGNLSREFLEQVPEYLNELRKSLLELHKASDVTSRQGLVEALYRRVHSMNSRATLAGLRPGCQLTAALEALLKELVEKPATVTPSTLRTIANVVDLLKDLFVPGIKADLAEAPPINIMVVDDDLLSRRAMIFALQRFFPAPLGVETPEAALKLAAERVFDVIFMDVIMPGMDGFALCEQVRADSLNKNTPVVFVTSQSDFQSRVQSTLCGGNDLIAKPFLFIEVTVKALAFALRNRLTKIKNSVS